MTSAFVSENQQEDAHAFRPVRDLKHLYDGRTLAHALAGSKCLCGGGFGIGSDVHIVECAREGPHHKERMLIHADSSCRRVARRAHWDLVPEKTPETLLPLLCLKPSHSGEELAPEAVPAPGHHGELPHKHARSTVAASGSQREPPPKYKHRSLALQVH